MKYLALLRGINVGGKGIIKMLDLRQMMETAGFKNVETYIQSGNVVFESDSDNQKISEKLEELLLVTFKFNIKVVVISDIQLKKVLNDVPRAWKNSTDLRQYIAFIKEPLTPSQVVTEVELKDGVDFVDVGPGVLYLSTKMAGLTQSNFPKLIRKKIYQEMTMRNYNTVQKLMGLTTPQK